MCALNLFRFSPKVDSGFTIFALNFFNQIGENPIQTTGAYSILSAIRNCADSAINELYLEVSEIKKLRRTFKDTIICLTWLSRQDYCIKAYICTSGVTSRKYIADLTRF